MTIRKQGSGDEVLVSEMSDEELLRERDYWNELLQPAYWAHSGKYDTIASVVKEIEREINRRSHEGPPWLAD